LISKSSLILCVTLWYWSNWVCSSGCYQILYIFLPICFSLSCLCVSLQHWGSPNLVPIVIAKVPFYQSDIDSCIGHAKHFAAFISNSVRHVQKSESYLLPLLHITLHNSYSCTQQISAHAPHHRLLQHPSIICQIQWLPITQRDLMAPIFSTFNYYCLCSLQNYMCKLHSLSAWQIALRELSPCNTPCAELPQMAIPSLTTEFVSCNCVMSFYTAKFPSLELGKVVCVVLC